MDIPYESITYEQKGRAIFTTPIATAESLDISFRLIPRGVKNKIGNGQLNIRKLKNTETYKLNWNGKDYLCKVYHMQEPFKDVFNLELEKEVVSIPIELDKLNKIPDSKSPFVSLFFEDKTIEEVLNQYFNPISDEDRLKIEENILQNNSNCTFIDLEKDRKPKQCVKGLRFDRIKMWDMVICNDCDISIKSLQDPKTGVMRKVLEIPVKKYAHILKKLDYKTYNLSMIVPKNISDEDLQLASNYLSSAVGMSKAKSILENGKGSRISILKFFSEYARGRMHHFDYDSENNCHTFASRFNYLPNDNNNMRWGSDKKYFTLHRLKEGPKFGDILSLGKSHSTIYLANGYVAMKDDNGNGLSYRILHLNDLKDTNTNGVNSLQFVDRFPTQFSRRK